MPPSRFANVSKWRNALLTPAKPEGRYHELALAQPPDVGSFVRASSDWIVTKAASGGNLILLPHDAPGKYARQPPSFNASPVAISDFATSNFDDGLIAVGADNGEVSVFRLPPTGRADGTAFPPTLSEPPQLVASLPSSGVRQPLTSLAFHTTSSDLLAASVQDTVKVYDMASGTSALELAASSPILVVDWSQDGATLASTGKDGIVSLFDARAGAKPISTHQAHANKVKPSRLAFVRSHLVTTGFSAMREREWAVWDPRSLASPIKRGTIDTSTGVITPLVDQDRGLVYLVGKGDATLRWVEVDDAKTFPTGNCPLNFTIGGGGLVPSTVHRVMEGEVDRLILASTASDDCLVPVSVTVPRRQYIDFHPDLYPPTSSRVAAQCAQEWLSGKDASVQLVSQDPARADQERRQASQKASTKATPAASSAVAAPAADAAPREGRAEAVPTSHPAPATSAPALTQTHTAAVSSESASTRDDPAVACVETPKSISASAPVDASVVSVQPASGSVAISSSSNTTHHSSAKPAQQSAAVSSPAIPAPKRTAARPTATPATDAPRWSRRFLLGSTPLIAAHQNLSGLDLGMPPDGRMLAANEHFLLFPLAGPGGRLGVHSVKETGRIPTLVPALTAPSKLIDFALDPFDAARAVSVHDDASIRVWRLPANGEALPESGIETPERVLSWKRAGKQSELAFHPTAKDLLASCSPEKEGNLLLWNLDNPQQEPRAVPIEGDGTTSLSWSPDGTAIALSCKDKAIRVVTFNKKASTAKTQSESTDDEGAAKTFLQSSIAFGKHGTRPHVTLTFAQSSDGKIAGEGKKQLALSGKESMLMTHALRTLHDGILVGIGTVLNDNPQLNARLLSSPPPVDKLPRPVVMDSSLRTPLDCKLLQNAKNGTGRAPLIVCAASADEGKKEALREAGAEIVEVGSPADWQTTLEALSGRGIERLMVEGGAAVIDSLMGQRELVDTLLVTVAPRTVGAEGFGFSSSVPYPCPGGASRGDDPAEPLKLRAEQAFGPDRVIVWDHDGSAGGAGGGTEGNYTVSTLKFSDLRNCRLTWIDERHLAVAGHTVGSARQLRLLSVSSGKLEERSRLTLEVSPALLFPSYDADTNILWLWSKGERLISAYEVRVDDKQPLTALSTFQHGQPQLGVAFLSKKDVDPRKVEVAVSYRIEKGEIRRVSWTVPRLRPEFFQDDIFLPTRDTSVPQTTAVRWLKGEADEREPVFLDLRPDDMELLSKAPEIKKESKLPKAPVAKVLSEDEKKEKLLDGIFKRAKHRGGTAYDAPADEAEEEESDDEIPVGSAAKRAPDDGDWSD